MPASNRRLDTIAQELLIQDNHVTPAREVACRVSALAARVPASAIASRERRPLESVIRASMVWPAARRSRTPATSIRVYLNVGRPRHTAGAETINFPKGMYSYDSPPTISCTSCCFMGHSLPEATRHNQRSAFLL